MQLTEKDKRGDQENNLGEVECQDCGQGSDSPTQLNICEEVEVQKELMINYAYIEFSWCSLDGTVS